MGFFDSIKGFGTSVFETLGAGFQAIAPSFIEAGANALFTNLFPNQQPGGSRVFRPPLGPAAPLLLPPGASRPAVRALPTQQPFQTFGPQPRPTVFPGGAPAMPHFPGDALNVTQAAFPVLPAAASGVAGAALDFFDLPGIDLRLPFTADARTGGTPFFNPVGARAQSPRSLIMQLNPSTGKPTFFRHAGRPIMFSGDRALCKRVDKIARRAGRSRPRR